MGADRAACCTCGDTGLVTDVDAFWRAIESERPAARSLREWEAWWSTRRAEYSEPCEECEAGEHRRAEA